MSIGGYDKIRHDEGAVISTVPYDGNGGLYRINIYEVHVILSLNIIVKYHINRLEELSLIYKNPILILGMDHLLTPELH